MSVRDPLATYFGELARRFGSVRTVDETLTVIVLAALDLVPTCEHASVSYLRGRELTSRSSNDDIGPQLDTIQTEVQEGPCLDAIRHGTAFSSDDLGNDPRWPEYGPRAVAATGIRSSLSTPLDSGADIVGALNLFSTQPGGFRQQFDGHAAVAILAAHATTALYAAFHREQMESALLSRDLIGQAKGILMAHGNVDEDAAFAQLAAASQRMNVRVAEIARRLVDGTLSDRLPGGTLEGVIASDPPFSDDPEV